MIHHLNELVPLQAGDAEWTTVRVGASRQSNQVDSGVANPSFSIYAVALNSLYTNKGNF